MVEYSFSTLWGSPKEMATREHSVFEWDADAKAARDACYKELKLMGIKARRWTLRNQVRPYWGLGDPCGRSCTVYKITTAEF